MEESPGEITILLRDFCSLMPGTNRDPVEVRIYRRGHPLFMSMPGVYTQVLPLARQPMERVFFANTDSEGPVSTISGAITSARRAAKEYETMLVGPRPANASKTLGVMDSGRVAATIGEA